MQYFKQKLEELVTKLDDRAEVQVSPDTAPGDLSTQLGFIWAQEKGVEPGEAAEQVVEQLELPRFVESTEVYQGHVNFHLNRAIVSETVLQQVLEEGEEYGGSQKGEGGRIVLEYSSPNIGKPMHIGHLLGSILGESLKHVLRYTGYDVTAVNYPGDWGTQYGKLIAAYKKWGSEERMGEDPVQHMYELYVKFHDEAEDSPGLEEEGREWFKKLEEGDEEAEELWEWFREESMAKFEELYDLLGVSFDEVAGESFYQDKMQPVIQEALDKNIAKTDPDNSIIIPFEDRDWPPLLLQKSDGATLYATRDLAMVKHRKQKYDFDTMGIVVGREQELHFNQVFTAADRLGYAPRETLQHIQNGMLQLPEGSMSTRAGQVIFAEDLLQEAVSRAAETVKEKNPGLAGKQRVAENVGVAAVKYFVLSHNRVKDITFDWEIALNWTGNSGPYLQYSYARATGILEETTENPDPETGTVEDPEYVLVKKLAVFPQKVEDAAEEYKPNHVANYLNDLCETFNTFYEACRVAGSDKESFRTAIVESFVHVLGAGLHLLGIEPLEDM